MEITEIVQVHTYSGSLLSSLPVPAVAMSAYLTALAKHYGDAQVQVTIGAMDPVPVFAAVDEYCRLNH